MMYRAIAGVLGLSLVTNVLNGCVTTHVRDPEVLAGGTLAMSCTEQTHLRAARNALVICTFENRSDAWVTVDVERVQLPAGTRALTAAESRDYAQALLSREAQDGFNTNAALTSVLLAGLTTAVAGRGTATGAAGAGAAILAIGAGAAHDGLRSYRDAQSGGGAGLLAHGPESLQGEGFRVPAGMFVRKAIALEFASGGNPPQGMVVCLRQPEPGCRTMVIGDQGDAGTAARRRFD